MISCSCPINTNSVFWDQAVTPDQGNSLHCASLVPGPYQLSPHCSAQTQPISCTLFHMINESTFPLPHSSPFLPGQIAPLTHHHYHSPITKNSGSRHEKHGFYFSFSLDLAVERLQTYSVSCGSWELGPWSLRCQSQLGPSIGGKVRFSKFPEVDPVAINQAPGINQGSKPVPLKSWKHSKSDP